MSSMKEQRDVFEKFCQESYGGFGNSSHGCPKSKTVTKSKGENIVKVLMEYQNLHHNSSTG